MRVEPEKSIRFDELCIGDVFCKDGQVYIKVDKSYGVYDDTRKAPVNCVDLIGGRYNYVDGDDFVTPHPDAVLRLQG